MEEEAITFALHAHGPQKYGDQPYEVHLRAVRQVLKDFAITNPDLARAAWLHDTLEDTPTSFNQILTLFGPHVANLVETVTGRGATRHERNADAYGKIIHFPFDLAPMHATLKLADRIANVEASRTSHNHFRRYKSEHPGFVQMLQDSGVLTVPTGKLMFERLTVAFKL